MCRKLYIIIIAMFFSFDTNLYSEDFWEKVYDTPGYYISDIVVDNEGIIYVGLSFDMGQICENSVLKSSNNGLTWTVHNIDTNKTCIHSMVINQRGFLYAGTHQNGVFRSTDKGENWQEAKNGIKKWSCITSIAISPNGSIFAISPGKINKSTDDGESWREVYTYQFMGLRMNTLVINKIGVLFACINDFNLYRSTDDGFSWIKAYDNLDGKDSVVINTIAIDHNDGLYISTLCHLYYSSNEGKDWTNIDNNLPSCDLTSILPMNNSNIYITNYGPPDRTVYFWNNGNKEWYNICSGLGGLNHAWIIKVIDDGYLLVGTDSGLYRSRYPITSIAEKIASNNHFFVEPNIINSVANINFQISKPSNILIRIFDVLGNEISEIADDYYITGKYSISYDASSFVNGIYFVNLMSEDESRTLKIIVHK